MEIIELSSVNAYGIWVVYPQRNGDISWDVSQLRTVTVNTSMEEMAGMFVN